jgi:Na+-transporting methylmalonyl-CoA/oxaloacetate decarboxylase gamma subunit
MSHVTLNKIKKYRASIMILDAMRILLLGFSVVFFTLITLAISLKAMSFVCKIVEKKEEK